MGKKDNIFIKNKKAFIELLIAAAWISAALFGVNVFNQNILMTLPRITRMIVMPLTLLLVAIGPAVIALIAKNKPSELGFTKNKICKQILLGVGLGAAMSLILTLPFHLLGLSDWVDSGKHYTHLWQFSYEFFYCIVGVGVSEEFIFRGFIYHRLSLLSKSEVFPILVSSVIFGLYHIFGGAWLQVISTAAIGVLLCIFRAKIKDCSTLSLILAHGIYDALITVWAAVFI